MVAAHFLGRTAAFVLGEEAVLLVPDKGDEQRLALHGGGILSAASDGVAVVTGGDDGKVFATDAKGESRLIATDAKRRWIDHVAAGPDGAVAWSAGKTAFGAGRQGRAAFARGAVHRRRAWPSRPRALRLAIAHYNGVTLWFPNAQAAPEVLEWKGSHHHVAFSPNGQFLVTAMQEPALHGWRVVDAKHMRMSGYSARVRSFGWTAGGKWLATSGSEQLVLWPFQCKDGPMGKQPKMFAAFAVRATVVACHPKQEVVAVGYADGTVLLVRIEDGAEVLAQEAGRGAGHRARLGRRRHAAGVRHRGRRGRRDRSWVNRGGGLSRPVFAAQAFHAGELADVPGDEQKVSTQGLRCDQTIVRSDFLSPASQLAADFTRNSRVRVLERDAGYRCQKGGQSKGVPLAPIAHDNASPEFENRNAGYEYAFALGFSPRRALAHQCRPLANDRNAGVAVEQDAQSKSKSRSCIGGCGGRSGNGGPPIASMAANIDFRSLFFTG